jgi:hypothetical protein|nr:MAG TPA: Morphogenesis protein 1 wall, phi29, hydrolase, infection [Caudoviricetes sp.]
MKFDFWDNTVTINGKKRSLHRIEMILFILFMAGYFAWFMSPSTHHIKAEPVHEVTHDVNIGEPVKRFSKEQPVVIENKPTIAEVLASLDEVEYDVYTELRKEFTHEVSVAIMGNIYQESHMNPYSDVGSRGLFQLEGVRLTKFISWADANGYNYHNPRAQIAYMMREMKSRDIDLRLKGKVGQENLSEMKVSPLKGGYEEFKNLRDIELATRLFQATYERAGTPMIDDRIAFAYRYDSMIHHR